jgi:hypothetical protein
MQHIVNQTMRGEATGSRLCAPAVNKRRYTPGKYRVIIGILVRRIAHRWQALDGLVTVYIIAVLILFMVCAFVFFWTGSTVALHCKAARHLNLHLAWEETNAGSITLV